MLTIDEQEASYKGDFDLGKIFMKILLRRQDGERNKAATQQPDARMAELVDALD